MPRTLSAVKIRPVTDPLTTARDVVVIVPLSRLSDEAARDRLLAHLGATFPRYRFSLTSLTPFDHEDIVIMPVLAAIRAGEEPVFERPSEDLLDGISTAVATFLERDAAPAD